MGVPKYPCAHYCCKRYSILSHFRFSKKPTNQDLLWAPFQFSTSHSPKPKKKNTRKNAYLTGEEKYKQSKHIYTGCLSMCVLIHLWKCCLAVALEDQKKALYSCLDKKTYLVLEILHSHKLWQVARDLNKLTSQGVEKIRYESSHLITTNNI